MNLWDKKKAILSYRGRFIFQVLTAQATGSHIRRPRALELWEYVSHLERIARLLAMSGLFML